MNILRLALFSSALILATGAFAQIDPDPDGLGIYFDEGATVVSATVPDGTELVTAYLILTNPSIAGNLSIWSVVVSSGFDGPGSARIVGNAYQGINVADNMPGSSSYSFMVAVNDQPPFPTSEITILAGIGIYPYYYDEPINLYVSPGAGFPAGGYETDLGSAEFHPSSGSWDLPVAVINGQAPVADESQSWGRVKSIFR